MNYLISFDGAWILMFYGACMFSQPMIGYYFKNDSRLHSCVHSAISNARIFFGD